MARRVFHRSFAGGEMSPEMYGRIDDVKFQNGAALLQNMLSKPQGAVQRRPGLRFLGEVKNSNSRTRLIPFRFSNQQTFAIEMGTATVQSRTIGYFRFYTGGAVLKYAAPDDYVEPRSPTLIRSPQSDIDFGTAHGLNHGDPIVFTIDPPSTCTFGANSKVVTLTGHLFDVGQPVMFTTNGTLPPEVEAGVTYYVRTPTTNTFAIAMVQLGTANDEITFSSAGTGTHKCGAFFYIASLWNLGLPPVQPGTTLYVRKIDSNVIKVCATYADALNGTTLTINDIGSAPSSMRMHFRYEIGDLIHTTIAGERNMYCLKPPWDTHLDHAPPDPIYWYELPVDGAFPTGGIYEVPHYYDEDDLFDLQYVQSNDVLTIVHPKYPIAELRRLEAARWLLQDVRFNASIAAPGGVRVQSVAGAGFMITAVRAITGPPGPAELTTVSAHHFADGLDTVRVIGLADPPAAGPGISDAVPYVVTNAQGSTFRINDYQTGAPINALANFTGLTAPRVRLISLSTDPVATYVVTALTESREESPASAEATIENNLYANGAKNQVSWIAVAGAARYRIYKKQNGIFGYIGETAETTFDDDNIAPDLGITPPILDNSLRTESAVTFGSLTVEWPAHGLEAGSPVRFDSSETLPTNLSVGVTYYVVNPGTDHFQVATSANGLPLSLTGGTSSGHSAVSGFFPGAVTYFEQRRFFAGALVRPQDIWATASGTESDLSYSFPTQDDDRIYFRIAARDVSTIRHIIPLAHLMVLTDSSEYRISPINEDALTPDNISVRPQSYIGASKVQPSVVNNTLLFPAARGGHIRETGFQWQAQAFVSGDVSLRAAHLFDDEEIVQQAYGKAPLPVVWFVSTDGNIYAITYAPEEAVGAWHRHVTDGTFESCAVITEALEDRLYVIVRRTIGGVQVRYVEEMEVQDVTVVSDGFFVDSGLTYSGVATTTITGLTHLEGETVAVLADGLVVSQKVVTNGQITLTTAASKVHVGLPFVSQIDTLPAIMQVEAWGQGQQKNVNAIAVRVFESGRFRSGPTTVATLVPSPDTPAGSLFTGEVGVVLPASWQDYGQVRIQQTDPLPLTVVGLAIEVAMGG